MDAIRIVVSPNRDERATNIKKPAQLYLTASLFMPYKVWLDANMTTFTVSKKGYWVESKNRDVMIIQISSSSLHFHVAKYWLVLLNCTLSSRPNVTLVERPEKSMKEILKFCVCIMIGPPVIPLFRMPNGRNPHQNVMLWLFRSLVPGISTVSITTARITSRLLMYFIALKGWATIDPPTIDPRQLTPRQLTPDNWPPTIDPPTIDPRQLTPDNWPPTIDPPTIDPRQLTPRQLTPDNRPPTINPPTIDPPTIDPRRCNLIQ